MQITPTSALLKALSSLPASGPAASPAASPAATRPQPVAPTGALAAAEKALAQRAKAQPAPQPAQGGEPPRNLPRGSIINIIV